MLTIKQMRALERFAQSKGILAIHLMENAGKQVASTLEEKGELEESHVIIFAGQGNNGGDAFVTARHLAKTNPVIILFFGKEEMLTEEAKQNYDKIKKNVSIIEVTAKEDLNQFHFQNEHKHLLIDGMVGIGMKGDVQEPLSFAIPFYNSLEGIKISLDIPSGLNADTGKFTTKCDADLIITFHDTKVALEENQEYKDKTVVVDIGIPHTEVDLEKIKVKE